MTFVVKNNAESTVADSPLAQAAVTLNVAAGEGANFPSTFPFLITLWDEETYPDPTDDPEMEITKCTARTTDAMTIMRAQEGTADVAHANGERVAMLITAGIFNDATNGIATKLDGIEAEADVTDATNVAAAGAFMADCSVDLTGTGIYCNIDTSFIALSGGNIFGALIRLHGKNEDSTPGQIVFSVPDAAKTGRLTPMSVQGANNAPKVDIFYGLDMHSKAIDAVLDPTTAQQGATKAYVDARCPSGLISMWHGTLANIPAGWVLCDGTNSTPDLRDKFVRGAAAAANPGATGGADTHTLSINEMPAHTHSAPTYQSQAGMEEVDPGVGATLGVTGSTGGGAAHNNMPAYYAIAYIMKT